MRVAPACVQSAKNSHNGLQITILGDRWQPACLQITIFSCIQVSPDLPVDGFNSVEAYHPPI